MPFVLVLVLHCPIGVDLNRLGLLDGKGADDRLYERRTDDGNDDRDDQDSDDGRLTEVRGLVHPSSEGDDPSGRVWVASAVLFEHLHHPAAVEYW
jgi:hypothetical protein